MNARLGKPQRLLVERPRAVKVWRNDWVVRRTAFHFVASSCERLAAGKRGPPSRDAPRVPAAGCFRRRGRRGLGAAARGFASLPRPLGGGAELSRCFYDYIVSVGGSAVGAARERAAPGRSFITVTHIMILSAASY